MTIHIELSPEQEALLAAAARQQGLEPAELAHIWLTEHLPELQVTRPGCSGNQESDPDLARRVQSLRGKYAHVGATTELLHRERQLDKAREDSHGGDGG